MLTKHFKMEKKNSRGEEKRKRGYSAKDGCPLPQAKGLTHRFTAYAYRTNKEEEFEGPNDRRSRSKPVLQGKEKKETGAAAGTCRKTELRNLTRTSSWEEKKGKKQREN